jgi:hypothetical protein
MYGTANQEPILNYWVNEKDCPYTEVKPLAGGAVTRWEAPLFYGAGKIIAGVILILKQTQKTEQQLIGRYDIRILKNGMII